MTFAPVAYEQVVRQMVRWLDAGFGHMCTGRALCAHVYWDVLGLGTCALALHCVHIYTGHMCIVHWLGAHVDHLCSVQQVLRQMVGMGTLGTLGREEGGGCQSARVLDTYALVIFFLFNQNQAL